MTELILKNHIFLRGRVILQGYSNVSRFVFVFFGLGVTDKAGRLLKWLIQANGNENGVYSVHKAQEVMNSRSNVHRGRNSNQETNETFFFLRISYTKPIIVIGIDLGCYSKNIIESLNQLVSYQVNLNYYYLIKIILFYIFLNCC